MGNVRGSVGSMMAATLISRALGFLKTILLVAAIGGTSAAIGGQAFEIANTAPTYLFALIAGGVLGAVLVPQIVRNLSDGSVGQEFDPAGGEEHGVFDVFAVGDGEQLRERF